MRRRTCTCTFTPPRAALPLPRPSTRLSGTNRVELERAKRAAVSVICNALESKATSAEDIGRQFLTYGHRSVQQYSSTIQCRYTGRRCH